MIRRDLAGVAARALEGGALRSPLSRALGVVWSRTVRVVRPLELPDDVRVVGVGGPTLGGSYKTPLTLALAQALAARGRRVAVVVHGYGGAVRRARRVEPTDDVAVVGDDALWLARDLRDGGVPVFVGARRDESVALAAAHAPLILVDGLLQARPARLALSILAMNGLSPWGSGACPPAGDLRAPREKLLRAADVIVRVFPADANTRSSAHARTHENEVPTFDTTIELVESVTREARVLSKVRVGLVLAIARPERVLASLAAHGITPVEIRLFRDHARPTESSTEGTHPTVDAWVTTPKCATKIGDVYEGARVVVLGQRIEVPAGLLERVEGPNV